MTGKASTAGTGRVLERRRAVALARHYREAEGLSIAQIADRLGRSPATVKAYFYDPTGEKARAVKARYVGVCRGCGAYTQPRNGKGDAYAYCKACHPGAIERRWTRERVLDAMRAWRELLRAAAVVVRLVASPTLAGAAAKRSSAWPTMSGPQRRSSPTCSAAGRRRAPLRRDATERGVRAERRWCRVVARRRGIAGGAGPCRGPRSKARQEPSRRPNCGTRACLTLYFVCMGARRRQQ